MTEDSTTVKNIDGNDTETELENDSEKNLEILKRLNELYKLKKLEYFKICLSAVFYSFDVMSDLLLGIKFLASQKYLYGFLTLLIVMGSSLFCNIKNKNAFW